MLAALTLDAEVTNQSQTVTIDPDGMQQKVRVELQYMEHTGRWTMSLFRADGSCIASHIPLVVSEKQVNDLVGIYGYKGIGSIICATGNPELAGIDPGEDTLMDYDIIWGDRIE